MPFSGSLTPVQGFIVAHQCMLGVHLHVFEAHSWLVLRSLKRCSGITHACSRITCADSWLHHALFLAHSCLVRCSLMHFRG